MSSSSAVPTLADMNSLNGSIAASNASDCSSAPSVNGLTPSFHASESVGAMMNSEMNKLSPTRTWFGGAVGRPRALRSKVNTMTTRVNDVIMMSSAGATDSRVIKMMSTTLWEGTRGPSSPPRSTLNTTSPSAAASVFAVAPVAPSAPTVTDDVTCGSTGNSRIAVGSLCSIGVSWA